LFTMSLPTDAFKNVFMVLVWDDYEICKVQVEKFPKAELSHK
jgi:hypothetical protein